MRALRVYTSVLPMEGTNYNHLFYFWRVASLGSVIQASTELGLSQPTISEQVRKLEESLGVKLFERAGRGLRLSEQGTVAFRYADEIFRTGRELREALSRHTPDSPSRFVVGVARTLSPTVACHLIAPSVRGLAARLVCIEDDAEPLFARLALHQCNLVLSDAPLPPSVRVKAYSHRLAASGISFLAARKLRRGRTFPNLLDAAPFLMPASGTPLHSALLGWFDAHALRPTVVGEFSNPVSLEIFGQRGLGIFAAPTIVERDIRLRCKLEVVGRTTEITQEHYAITTDRRLTHPAVAAIAKGAAVGDHKQER